MLIQSVKSSNIDAIGYEDGTLKVRFRNGGEYEYPDTSEADHADFMESASKGKWLNAFVAARSGVTQTKKPEAAPMKKEAPTVKASSSAAEFAGGVMRAQMSRTSRVATFRVPK